MKNYAKIVSNHKRPFRFLVGRALVNSRLCNFLTIPQRGYRLRFYPSNLSEQLWVDRGWRYPELRLWRDYLRPGDCVVDVGANVGDTVLTAANKVGPGGHIWAIEAHPKTYSYLLGNLALNRANNVTAINAAAATEAGRLKLSDDRRDDMNCVGGTGIEVDAGPLDNLVPHRGEVAFLKIDVEGYELPVLMGASEILKRSRCVYIEVAERHFQKYGYNIEKVLQLLRDHQFKLLRLVSDTTLKQIDVGYQTTGVENVIAVADIEQFCVRSGWAVK